MRFRELIAICFMASAAVRATAGDGPAALPASPPPKPTGFAESIEKRLVQLDVGVEGDPEAIRAITAKDFTLYVGGREIAGLILDNLCGEAPVPEPATSDTQPSESPPSVAPKVTRPRATFIFYFDQPHLTMMGRAGSLETARDLIRRLMVDGNRASIVSSARRLETIVPMTEDPAKLEAGLEKLRTNLKQWDSYATTEEIRAGEVGSAITNSMQCLIAQGYAQEEWQEARRSTQRIGFAVSTLTETTVPKALVYFGDSLRQNAGLHFLHIPESCPAAVSAELVPSAAFEFDALINEALSRGVHFFTIQAEGLLAYHPGWDQERHRHAQDALVGLAAETGGEAFLGGASNKYIEGKIAARTSCSLLLSFPPGDLPRDKPLAITLALHVPKVKIQTQGRIVLPSQASIDNARLLAAFVDPASADDGSLRVLLVPRGGDGKTWSASVQVRLYPSGAPNNSVDMGASIVRQDKVQTQFSASIATASGTRAMVIEKRLDMAPGEFSVVAVAKDIRRDDVVSSRLEAAWPNLAKSEAAIAPIAVLQNGVAAILKDGILQSSGLLARDVDEPIDPSASVTIETVVCRGTKTMAPVVVERWLEDGLAKEFAPMTIAEAGSPCLQTVDAVSPGRLKSGIVDYRVVARIGDEIVAQERRTLRIGPTGAR